MIQEKNGKASPSLPPTHPRTPYRQRSSRESRLDPWPGCGKRPATRLPTEKNYVKKESLETESVFFFRLKHVSIFKTKNRGRAFLGEKEM